MQRWRRDLLEYARAGRLQAQGGHWRSINWRAGHDRTIRPLHFLGVCPSIDEPIRQGGIRSSWDDIAESLAWDGVDVSG
jgi:hypothetical protein